MEKKSKTTMVQDHQRHKRPQLPTTNPGYSDYSLHFSHIKKRHATKNQGADWFSCSLSSASRASNLSSRTPGALFKSFKQQVWGRKPRLSATHGDFHKMMGPFWGSSPDKNSCICWSTLGSPMYGNYRISISA